MKVLVISGFLGAGKTTFIRELMKQSGKPMAILENDYGAVGVDAYRLQKGPRSYSEIWEMTEGCICCSKRGDFAASIITIANSADPEFLIIEPTGIGMLGNVLSHIRKVEYERIQILSPITIVDGNSFNRYLGEVPEILKNQISHAGTILISKMEQAGSEERAYIEEQIRQINPRASVIGEHYTRMPKSFWEELLLKKPDGSMLQNESARSEEEAAHLFETYSLRDWQAKSPGHLIALLERIIRGGLGNIMRAKGTIAAGRCFCRFDLADDRYSILFTPEEETAGIVFIGKQIHRKAIAGYLMEPSRYGRMRP